MAQREKAIVNKKRFWVKIPPKFAEGFKKSNHVSSKYFTIDTLLVAHGRSHFLLRQSCNKRKKSEELKEIELSRDQRDIKDAELMTEIDAFKRKTSSLWFHQKRK